VVRRRGERGGALLLALAVVGLAALAVGTALGGLQQETAAVRRADTSARLRALADAGVAATLARLAVDPHADGLGPQRFADGEIASRIEWLGHETVNVMVTATARQRSLTVVARVRLDRAGPTVLGWRGPGAPGPGDEESRTGSGSRRPGS
jgi:uncharacterized membrane protein